MKKKFFKISGMGFTTLGIFFAALVVFTNLQKEKALIIPEIFGMLFLMVLSVTLISFIIAFVLDMIEEVRAKHWSTVLNNVGLMGMVVTGLFLWDTRLLSVPIDNMMLWLVRTLITICAIEAGAYILSQKMA